MNNKTFLHIIGLKFWKVGSRKIYAVRDSEMGKKRSSCGHASNVDDISSSSDDNEDFISELKELKEAVNKLVAVTPSMNIPLGLRSILYDTFKCSICQSTPMQPPIIFAKCCKTILGCEGCVDRWYRGTEGQGRTCPKCRSERAFVETCRMNGMDEFLAVVTTLMDVNSDSDEVQD